MRKFAVLSVVAVVISLASFYWKTVNANCLDCTPEIALDQNNREIISIVGNNNAKTVTGSATVKCGGVGLCKFFGTIIIRDANMNVVAQNATDSVNWCPQNAGLQSQLNYGALPAGNYTATFDIYSGSHTDMNPNHLAEAGPINITR